MNRVLQKYRDNYLEITIFISFLWMSLAYIPFFAPISDWLLMVDLILFLPGFILNRDYLKLAGMSKIYMALLLWSVLSLIVTKSLNNVVVWDTIILSFAFYLFFNFSSEAIKKRVIYSIFVIINIVSLLSLLLYFVVIFTDLEHSSIYRVSYSLGNVFQSGRLCGVLISFNILGPMAAIACLLSYFYILSAKGNKKIMITNIILFTLNMVVCYLTKCRSAIVATGVVIYAIILFSIPPKNRKNWFIVFMGIGIVLLITFILSLPMLSNLTGRDWVTGSGRTPIYEQVIYLSTHVKPIFGFGSNENISNYSLANNFILHNYAGSHNMYLEVAILFGIPAMVIYIASLLVVVINTLRCFLKGADMYKTNIILPFLMLIFMIVFELFEHHGLFRLTPMMAFFLMAFFQTDHNTKSVLSNKG